MKKKNRKHPIVELLIDALENRGWIMALSKKSDNALDIVDGMILGTDEYVNRILGIIEKDCKKKKMG